MKKVWSTLPCIINEEKRNKQRIFKLRVRSYRVGLGATLEHPIGACILRTCRTVYD